MEVRDHLTQTPDGIVKGATYLRNRLSLKLTNWILRYEGTLYARKNWYSIINIKTYIKLFIDFQGWTWKSLQFSSVHFSSVQFSSVQSLSRIWLFVTPWIAARQASLSITNSQSSLRLTLSPALWDLLECPWNSPGQNTGEGSLSLLQGIFLTQELNPGLLQCRQILYQLSYQGSPTFKDKKINF